MCFKIASKTLLKIYFEKMRLKKHATVRRSVFTLFAIKD